MKSRIKTTFKFLLWSVIIVGLLGLEGNSLAVAEGSWTTPTDLSIAGEYADGSQIASSADGTKLAATWRRYDSGIFIVQAATSTDSGATWNTPILLSAIGGTASSSQIASSADGTKLTATWYRYDGSTYIVQAATSTDSGATWNTAIDLSLAGQHAFDPQIASSADGTKLTATWSRYDGSTYIVQAATSTDSGATWPLPANVVNLSAIGGSAHYPRIASSADGTKLTATWMWDNGFRWIVQAATSTDSGATWNRAIDLSLADHHAVYPQIASSADGTKLTATWYRSDGSNWIVQAASSTNSGATWNTVIDLSAAGSDASFPQIVSSADGTKLTAVWEWNDGSNWSIQTSSVRSVSGSRRMSHHHVTFDSTGGTCAEHSTAWTVRFRGSYTLPTDCTRDGYVFLGWTRDPELAALENLLTRTISRSANLTAVWGELPTAPSTVSVLANFLCRQNCDSALIVWPSSSSPSDTAVITLDGNETSCSASGEISGLKWCLTSGLAPGGLHTAAIAWRNQYGTGAATSTIFTLN